MSPTNGAQSSSAEENAPLHLICNGIQSGSISLNESQKPAQGQARVHKLKNRANGVVTQIERARIHAAQSIQSAADLPPEVLIERSQIGARMQQQ